MRRNLKNWLIAVVVLAGGGLAIVGLQSPAAEADDTYYMIIFACQTTPNRPRTAHSFAAFVKVPDKDGKPDTASMEAHMISWITEPENFGLLRPAAPGRNLSLEESMQWAANRNAAVIAFGPYRIQKELYDRAMAQRERLRSGAVAYKATDRRVRQAGVAVNCFHAISDMVEGPLLDTGSAFGEPASAMVREHLSRWIVERDKTHRSLIAPLGLDKYTITWRD